MLCLRLVVMRCQPLRRALVVSGVKMKLEKLGIAITLLWFTLFVCLLFFKWESASSMGLNEWGDFLAGATAPIAFLWLIIGYVLQRHELALNTEALKLQHIELERQAKELAKQSEFQEIQARLAESQHGELMAEQAMARLGLSTHWRHRDSLENDN
ncbi:hypothetical protein FLL71_20240 [Vibrio cholerae]|nr:hypothetical protein FLL71_20240 [Vibrio cholerae]